MERFFLLSTHLFFGANFTALRKKDGEVHPIAVGCTLRRLVAKCASSSVKENMTNLLAPLQLGFGFKRGAEGAVHAACCLVQTLQYDQLLLKLDFRNAFNSLCRDKMLQAVGVSPITASICPLCLQFTFSTLLGGQGHGVI